MPPSPVATRFSLLGCTLATVAAFALSACGGDGAATAENVPTTAPETATKETAKASAPAAAQPCPAKVGTLVDSLERLRRQLTVGLSYEQYAARVKALKASYDAIPFSHLSIACLRSTGSPAEAALNKYIDGANAWGECLADDACTTATIEPVLQRKWRVASHFIADSQ